MEVLSAWELWVTLICQKKKLIETGSQKTAYHRANNSDIHFTSTQSAIAD